jgi:hypothetical protein
MNDKQQDDVLIDEYRRASASDADRPSAATRAAILAEAAAAARRNAPAANESRFWLRAVAGIAVFGIGVLLWRQTDYRTPDVAPVVGRVPVTQTLESIAKAEGAPSRGSAPKSESAAVEERSVDSVRTDTTAVNDQPPPQPFPASPASPSPPPMVESSPPQIVRNTADEELEETHITGTRIQQPNDERIDPAFAVPAAPRVGGPPLLDSTTLLLRYFPAQYQSDASHSVWLVLNAAGDVLQSGELARGQRLADLAPQLGRTLGDRVPRPWQVQTLRNARGQPIELAIARVP